MQKFLEESTRRLGGADFLSPSSSPPSAPLRVHRPLPGRSGVQSGGDAVRRRQRRGAGRRSLGLRVESCCQLVAVPWRDARSSSSGLGQIWRSAAILFLSAWLRWQELSPEWMWEHSSSLNKGPLLFLWRPCFLVLLCNAKSSTAKSTVKPPWWWRDGDDEAEEAFFNKRCLSLL
jgi:hypothetical protein